jgi:hypothetical protein
MAGSAWQMLSAQVPLQQREPSVHASSSEMHVEGEHTPF